MTTPTEPWEAVAGWEGLYEVCRDGRVRSLKRTMVAKTGQLMHVEARELRNWPSSTGYPVVRLQDRTHGRGRACVVHRLVAIAFIPNPEGKPEVNHIDGNKANFQISNLEWVTRSENEKHSLRIGLRVLPVSRGENHARAKVTEAQVRAARETYDRGGVSVAAIARGLGLCWNSTRALLSGKNWTCVPRGTGPNGNEPR